MADGLASFTDKVSAPVPTELSVGAALPGEMAGSAALNLIRVLQEEANSPDAVKAAQAKERLSQMDRLAAAQASGDINIEREFLERRMLALGGSAS